MTEPLVSVVTATYNRSNVLRVAIESIRRQSLEDWELIVVGDACTDDSEEVVAAFGDPRIRWENLPANTGDQSTPNNVGAGMARGRYVAYLNHDDVWFPDHLELAVAHLEATGADLVFTLGAAVQPSGRTSVTGIAPSGRYELLTFAPASTWVLRREVIEAVGPWLPPSASREVPSQHWLARAHRAGCDLRSVPVLSTVAIVSTTFEHAYRTRRSAEQEDLLARMADPTRLRAEVLTTLLLDEATAGWPRSLPANVRQAAKHLVYRWSARAGVHPHATAAALRLQGRGSWMGGVYQRRGIERRPGGAS